MRQKFLETAKTLANIIGTSEKDMDSTTRLFLYMLDNLNQKHVFETRVPSRPGLEDMTVIWKMLSNGMLSADMTISIHPRFDLDKKGNRKRIRVNTVEDPLCIKFHSSFSLLTNPRREILAKQSVDLFGQAYNFVKVLQEEAERMNNLGYQRLTLNRFYRLVRFNEDWCERHGQKHDLVILVTRGSGRLIFVARKFGQSNEMLRGFHENIIDNERLDDFAVRKEIDFMRSNPNNRMNLITSMSKALSEKILLKGKV